MNIGVDEAGRGPLAGPVYAAAVCLDPDKPVAGLKDSKALSAKKRERISVEIRAQARAFGVGRASVDEIDTLNILRATLLAMSRAVIECLKQARWLAADFDPARDAFARKVLEQCRLRVDGNHHPGSFDGPWQWPYQTQTIIAGDQSVPEISAASVLAKVARDAEMKLLDRDYPAYGFARHAGYGTAEHLALLRQYGPSPVHRKSFAPVRELLP